MEKRPARRKPAADALSVAADTSAAQLRFLLDQIPGVLWTTDLELRLTSSVGSGLAAMKSRPNARLGERIGDLFPTDAEPEAAHRRALAGHSATYVASYKGRIVRCHVDPLLDESGTLMGTVGVSVDVTDARLAELGLATRFAVTRVLSKSATVGEAAPGALETLGLGLDWDAGIVWVTDAEAKVLRCQWTWQKPGTAALEVLGLSRRIVLPPSTGLPGRVWVSGDPDWVEDLVRDGRCPRGGAAIQDGLRSACAFAVRLDADVRAVVELFSRSERPRDEAGVALLADVGLHMGQFLVRVRAAEDLARSRAQLAEAQKIAHMGSWEWDIVADRVAWSDELYRIYGLVPQEASVNYHFFLDRVHPDDRQEVSDVVARAITGRTPHVTYEHRIIREDGAVRRLQARAELVKDATGAPVRLSGTAQDVTDVPTRA